MRLPKLIRSPSQLALCIAIAAVCSVLCVKRLNQKPKPPLCEPYINYTDPWFMSEEKVSRDKSTFLLTPLSPLENTGSCVKRHRVTREMVTFVKSAAEHHQRRQLIRETWGSVVYLNGWSFKTLYLVGKAADGSTNAALAEEHSRFNDILQYDGPDGYDTMPYKVVAGMEWASAHLGNEVFYASADDDFLVDLVSFTGRFDKMMKDETTDTVKPPLPVATNPLPDRTPPIMCLFMTGDRECVDRKTKWKILREEWSSTVYPRYCHGGMYVMPMSITAALLQNSYSAPVLRFDDVWITGVLRRRARIGDHLVMNMEAVATHYGESETERSMMDIMAGDWKRSFESMVQNGRNEFCTLELR